MIQKQVLVPGRVRRPPADGWSWIDRRFLREHAARLSHKAIVLYFFLTAVSDKDGLSFYGDASIALRLRMGEAGMVAARDELVAADLVAYRAPWRRCSPCPPSGCSGVAAVWPPSARSSAAWPIPLTLPRNGDPHESRLVGGIRRLHEIEGLSARAIARRLHCCTKTVAKALTLTAPPAVAAQAKESIFAPYRARIDALLAKYPDLSAVRVVEEIARGENGYRGSVYPVRRYLHQARPVRGRVYQEVLYEPGEALQVDWGDCGRVTVGQTPRKVSVFVAVLC